MNLIQNTQWNNLNTTSYDIESTSSDEETFEIDVKPKTKYFDTVQEKKLYIEEYTKKKKTELCKNFVMTGKCKYGTECSFAHGNSELQPKTHLHTKYKTKPCKRYFQQGYCAYGTRCQYIHGELINKTEFDGFLQSSYKELGIRSPISSKILKPDQRNDIQRFILTMKVQRVDLELLITNKPRLTCFQLITNPSCNFLSDDSSRKENSIMKKSNLRKY